jgi:hypothetical protein
MITDSKNAIGPALSTLRDLASEPLPVDFGLAELHSLVNRFESNVSPTASETMLKTADKIVKAIQNESVPPSQSSLEAWLAHFISSASEC